jgi:ParB family chromosome partitioning protein
MPHPEGVTMGNFELGTLYNLALSELTPNPDQPRKVFSEAEINMLAESIKEKGLLQPILVKKMEDGKIIIVSGERRFRAHQLLERETIPSWFTTGDAEELALVENLVREDLNPMETAEALMKLKERLGDKKQADLAKLIGKAESTLSEYLSLNNFPPDIRDVIRGNNRFALRDLKKIAVKKDPERQRELFEKYKNRILKLNPGKRAQGEEAHRNKLAAMQEYITKLANDEKILELSSLWEQLIKLKDGIETILNNLSELDPKFAASKNTSKKESKKLSKPSQPGVTILPRDNLEE